MKKKVIVIGLDGGTLDYVLPYKDKLPTFKYLMENGSWGPLQTVIQPHTAPAWPSYLTGKYPSKHSIYSFFYKTSTHDIEFIDSRNIDGPTIMDILSFYNEKSIVMNVPVTYPPWYINGIMISGMLTPSSGKWCLPEEISKEIPYYKIEPDVNFNEKDVEGYLKAIYDVMNKRYKAMLYLMDKYPWRFFTVVFRATDVISHTMRQYLEKDHPLHKKYGNEIFNLYKRIDNILKDILNRLDKDTTLMIMSDHGHGKFNKMINLNVWLLKNGYLKFKRDPIHTLKFLLFRLGFSSGTVYNIISKFNLQNIVFKLPIQKRYKARNIFLFYKDVDWKRTIAYSLGPIGQIYINVKGREPQGIVTPGNEYERIRNDLIKKLMLIKDPDTDEPVFERVIKKEQLYQGPYLDKAPDLYLIPTRNEYSCYELLMSNTSLFNKDPKRRTGEHKMNGIFMAYGDNIKRNNRIYSAKIVDLVPTILTILGYPYTTEMDGKVLHSIFDKKVKEKKVDKSIFPAKRNYEDKTIKNEKEIEDRLKSLGYI